MSTKNPRLSKPDPRKAISSVANRGLSVAVEFRHHLISVHVERQTPSPALAGAMGLSGRRRKRSRASETQPVTGPFA